MMRKLVSIVCLVFAILWYTIGGIIFIIYCIGVFQKEVGVYYAIQTIIQDWFSSLNWLIFVIFLLPGIFAYKGYERLSVPKDISGEGEDN